MAPSPLESVPPGDRTPLTAAGKIKSYKAVSSTAASFFGSQSYVHRARQQLLKDGIGVGRGGGVGPGGKSFGVGLGGTVAQLLFRPCLPPHFMLFYMIYMCFLHCFYMVLGGCIHDF